MAISGTNQGGGSIFEFLKVIVGEDGLAFVKLDKALTSLKENEPNWQASYFVGVLALLFLYNWRQAMANGEISDLALLVGATGRATLSDKDFNTILRSYSKESASAILALALEPLERRYSQLSANTPGYTLTQEQAHILFHTRFALGTVLLLKGQEDRAYVILREMADTKTRRRGETYSSEGLDTLDVILTKALTAEILQRCDVTQKNYAFAIYLLQEAIASNGPGNYSSDLVKSIPPLLREFAAECERSNSFEMWVNLFDRAAGIAAVCGRADVSGELPSECSETSPQFFAWMFGQFVARFANTHSGNPARDEQFFPFGYYGDDWPNGTMVASLLAEYSPQRPWTFLRSQYLLMWESLPRFQWLSVCEAGTRTDLYWAMRIGFADKMLEATGQGALIRAVDAPLPAITPSADMPTDIPVSAAKGLQQFKLAQDMAAAQRELQILVKRQPRSAEEIHFQLQQIMHSIWDRLPSSVVDLLTQAESCYETRIKTNDAKNYFNEAVEAAFHDSFTRHLTHFMLRHKYRRMAICFPAPRGVEHKTPVEISKISLFEWSNVFEVLSSQPGKTLASLGSEELKAFIKERFYELNLMGLSQLSISLRDFYSRRSDSAHYHLPRHEQEKQDLEVMRQMALGLSNRPSIIVQIFEVFSGQ